MNKDLQVFEQGWPGKDTVCGWGSQLEHTHNVRSLLPRIIKEFGIKTMNDAGCGDLFWIKTIDLTGVDYRGYDAFKRSTWPALLADGWNLEVLDITSESMREADLVMCRDVFIHLPNNMVLNALDKFKGRHKYLLSTNFLSPGKNDESYAFDNFNRTQTISMKHSKIDLRLPPFNLCDPLRMIIEDYPYKSLSLWEL